MKRWEDATMPRRAVLKAGAGLVLSLPLSAIPRGILAEPAPRSAAIDDATLAYLRELADVADRHVTQERAQEIAADGEACLRECMRYLWDRYHPDDPITDVDLEAATVVLWVFYRRRALGLPALPPDWA